MWINWLQVIAVEKTFTQIFELKNCNWANRNEKTEIKTSLVSKANKPLKIFTKIAEINNKSFGIRFWKNDVMNRYFDVMWQHFDVIWCHMPSQRSGNRLAMTWNNFRCNTNRECWNFQKLFKTEFVFLKNSARPWACLFSYLKSHERFMLSSSKITWQT